MKEKRYTIDAETKTVLEACAIKDMTVFLPKHLARPLYEKVNQVLIALGAIWDRKVGGHVFEYDIADELSRVLETGSYNNWKKDTDYYFTMSETLKFIDNFIPYEYEDRIAILDPSAGQGHILDYLSTEFPNAELHAVEINPRHIPILTGKGYYVEHGDFLKYITDRYYDLIVMNPPFKEQLEHIMKAFEMLRPGGTLVSVACSNIKFRNDGAFKKWNEFLKDKYCSLIDLPEDSFKQSGTGTNTVMLGLTRFDTERQYYRHLQSSSPSSACIEIENVPDELYGVTTVVVDIESFKRGRDVFPCASGNDLFLNKEMRKEIYKIIEQHSDKFPLSA